MTTANKSHNGGHHSQSRDSQHLQPLTLTGMPCSLVFPDSLSCLLFLFSSCPTSCPSFTSSVCHRLDHFHFVYVLRQMLNPSVLSGRLSSARAPRSPCGLCLSGAAPLCIHQLSVCLWALLHLPPSHGFLIHRSHYCYLTVSVAPILSESLS